MVYNVSIEICLKGRRSHEYKTDCPDAGGEHVGIGRGGGCSHKQRPARWLTSRGTQRSHVRHVSRLGRRTHRTNRLYARRAHRGNNNYAYGTHRGLRHGRRNNHGYVYNRVNWPTTGYNRYANHSRFVPNTSGTTVRGNTITVPATVTLPRSGLAIDGLRASRVTGRSARGRPASFPEHLDFKTSAAQSSAAG